MTFDKCMHWYMCPSEHVHDSKKLLHCALSKSIPFLRGRVLGFLSPKINLVFMSQTELWLHSLGPCDIWQIALFLWAPFLLNEANVTSSGGLGRRLRAPPAFTYLDTVLGIQLFQVGNLRFLAMLLEFLSISGSPSSKTRIW